MPPEIETPERVGPNAKKRIEELEKAVKAIFKALRAIEEHDDEPFVPAGEYLGEKFED